MQDEKTFENSILIGLGVNKISDRVLPLLLLANRLSSIDKLEEDKMLLLRESLIKDILSISSELTNLELYSENDIVRLRYCLSVFIDESLLRNEIFMNSFWANNTITIRLFDENLGGEKFFGIMQGWLENPSKNRDFLEVIYACLILGYRGKYAGLEDEKEKISFLCSNIANALATSSENKDDDIFKKAYENVSKDKKSGLNFSKINSYLALFGLIVVIGVFLYSHYELNKHIIKTDSTLTNTINSFTKEN